MLSDPASFYRYLLLGALAFLAVLVLLRRAFPRERVDAEARLEAYVFVQGIVTEACDPEFPAILRSSRQHPRLLDSKWRELVQSMLREREALVRDPRFRFPTFEGEIVFECEPVRKPRIREMAVPDPEEPPAPSAYWRPLRRRHHNKRPGANR